MVSTSRSGKPASLSVKRSALPYPSTIFWGLRKLEAPGLGNG